MTDGDEFGGGLVTEHVIDEYQRKLQEEVMLNAPQDEVQNRTPNDG